VNDPDIAVVMFDGRRVPRSLTRLRVIDPVDIDASLASARRVVVVGADADLASVLTRLLRAELLNVEAAAAAVFEDALSGVQAGHAGHFGYVVGVDRVGQADELRSHGADVVVTDLGDLL